MDGQRALEVCRAEWWGHGRKERRRAISYSWGFTYMYTRKVD